VINERAEVTVMLRGTTGVPLICIKASLLFRAAVGNADAFERFGPKPADLSVTPFKG
jgi:hypothetical protein